MSADFIDTNVLIYAHGAVGRKQEAAIGLIERLLAQGSPGISTQVMIEFYAAATMKMGMAPEEASAVMEDLRHWSVHRPTVSDLIRAAELQREYRVSWWDALILNSAMELGCETVWSEDLSDGQKYGDVRVRNPFRE